MLWAVKKKTRKERALEEHNKVLIKDPEDKTIPLLMETVSSL